MNPEIKEAHSNTFKQREKFEAKIIAPAKALEKLSDEALEGVVGDTVNGNINIRNININYQY